jgi:hypothetical protein
MFPRFSQSCHLLAGSKHGEDRSLATYHPSHAGAKFPHACRVAPCPAIASGRRRKLYVVFRVCNG